MNARTLQTLEFDKIRAQAAMLAASEAGRALVSALSPVSELERAQVLLEQTSEAESHLIRTGNSPVDAFPDVRELLARARIATALSARELLRVAHALKAARLAKERLVKPDEEHGRLLAQIARQLTPVRDVEEEILHCIISDEEIADFASPRLAELRRQIRRAGERAREKLQSLIHSQGKYLMEPIITIRSGRFVLPVKQEFRSMLPGLVHDQSGSGATLFIEPMSVVEIGNELKRWEGEEIEEIERILAEFTARLGPYIDQMITNVALLAELDAIFARARLARDMDAHMPKLNGEGRVNIVKGRHPLIPRGQVVPIDVWLGGEFTTLIVTGPNTGGKTVTLKTVGLFTLMALSGLYVPCGGGTELSVFTEVFADIGDEQSIEQSLSTFSSHMRSIVPIIANADESSLVLLDELGAGTDPTEGAALAQAILEHLHNRGARTLATTHYSELKAFALTRPGMENAAMAFDVATLRPTYKLSIGIPGKSNAFEISLRLGLDEAVIGRAREYLESEDVRFEDVIASAESRRAQAEAELIQAQKAREEAESVLEELKRQNDKIEEKRQKILEQAREKARELVSEAREDMEQAIILLKQDATSRAIQEARDTVRKREQSLHKHEEKPKVIRGSAPTDLMLGETVWIINLQQEATVLELPDVRGDLRVQAGAMKLAVNTNNLRKLEKPKSSHGTSAKAMLAARTASQSLHLRGFALDEALYELDKYLDDAVISGLHEVTLVHGKGTGVLRSGIQDALRKHPHVKEYRLGRFGEGESGVTVVTLK